MGTAAASKRVPRPVVGAYDRVFYSTIAIVMALAVVAGFGPTYYFKAVAGGSMITINGSPFTPLVHLHGIAFTGWVVLFIVQTALVASHRVDLHRRLGIVGGLLAGIMVTVGTATAISSAAAGGGPPGVEPLAFLAVPLFDMLLFSTFVAAALWLRSKKEAHKRLMLLAYISILAAAMARLPGVQPLGPLGFFGLAFTFLLAAVIYDLASRRRVHQAYIWGGTLLVISVPLRLWVSGTQAWKIFAEAITH